MCSVWIQNRKRSKNVGQDHCSRIECASNAKKERVNWNESARVRCWWCGAQRSVQHSIWIDKNRQRFVVVEITVVWVVALCVVWMWCCGCLPCRTISTAATMIYEKKTDLLLSLSLCLYLCRNRLRLWFLSSVLGTVTATHHFCVTQFGGTRNKIDTLPSRANQLPVVFAVTMIDGCWTELRTLKSRCQITH